MCELRSDEVALKRDVFNGMIDTVIDALGWLLVIGDEYPEVLRKTCGRLNAEDRLAQMSAILSGRTFDKRYEVADPDAKGNEESSYIGESPSNAAPTERRSDDLEAWKRALEQQKDKDSRNTRE